MATRPRLYYPAYQITNGLYTRGKEWMLRDTKQNYNGPYHKYTDGTVMTGGSYSIANSEYLIPYSDVTNDPTKTIYDDIRKGEDVKTYKTPLTYFPGNVLTIDDYKREYFVRYFVKRRNDATSNITEITEKQFKTLGKKGSGINGSLYFGISLRWKINGARETYLENNIKVFGVSETNKQTLFALEQKMSGITKFLGDLEEFSIYSKLTDISIREELL